MKFILFFILTFYLNVSFCADWKVARIVDEDGFTNIRDGRGINFNIIGTINADELFYCEISNSDWWKILGFEGYIYKSKVQLLELLPDTLQHNLLKKIFTEQTELVNQSHLDWRNFDLNLKKWKNPSDSLEYTTVENNIGYHEVKKYFPALRFLPIYYCRTEDTLIIQTLFETILAGSGTATENQAWAVGECFKCLPDLTSKQLDGLNNKQKTDIKSEIEFGLTNICDNPEELSLLKEILNRN